MNKVKAKVKVEAELRFTEEDLLLVSPLLFARLV